MNVLDVSEENGRVRLFVDHELTVAGEHPVGSCISAPGQTSPHGNIYELGFYLWSRPSRQPERECDRGARS